MIPNQNGDSSRGAQTPENNPAMTQAALVSYCMTRVTNGREVRDKKFASKWKEYTRLWRGFYTESDKNTQSERSRLIAPALQQAVEMTAAEMEEAVFNRTAWFDLSDDYADEVKGRLHVDHCHDTGVVRGLLCSHCNTALGKFQDSPELLTAAIRYIAGY